MSILNEFDMITTPQTWKDNLYNSIDSNSTAIRTRRKFPAAIAAALVIAILFSGTAIAIGFGWHIKLMEYFKSDEAQIQALDGAVSTPEATATKDGITVTVKQTLADAFGIYVLYEMTVPDGIELDDSVQWSMEVLNVPTVKTDVGFDTGSGGSEILEQAGNKRTVLHHLDTTAGFTNGDINFTLKDLVRYTKNDATGSTEITPIASGDWNLAWSFTFEDTGKTIDLDSPLSINGSNNTITKIVISPISFCAFIKGDNILRAAQPIIIFKDGSRITYDELPGKNKSFSYYLTDKSSMTYCNQLLYRFGSIINPANVVSIQIGDEIFSIE